MDIQDWLQGTADADQHSPTVRRYALTIRPTSANAVILQRSNSRKTKQIELVPSSVQPLQVHQRRGERARGKRSATSYGCTDHSDGIESYEREHDPYKR